MVPQATAEKRWRTTVGGLWAGLCLAICLSAALPAQTVRPLIDENIVKAPGKKASGKIEYYNDSLQPLDVTLEARSFTVSDTGTISYRPLDGDIHLKLSEMSFRIPPRQSHYVFYRAWSDKLPAWCVLYAAFSGFHQRTPEGFMIQVQLPHTIYLLPKQRLETGSGVCWKRMCKVGRARPAKAGFRYFPTANDRWKFPGSRRACPAK
jgi:hypothetical protein